MLYVPRSPIWRPLTDPELGLMVSFSNEIAGVEARTPGALPDIRRGPVILVGSDYGGEHDTALYQSLSFLFADFFYSMEWERRRVAVRSSFLGDGRRMEFKKLNDKKRMAALPWFLSAASAIQGLSVTLLIDKRIRSLFAETGKADRSVPGAEPFKDWSSEAFEKMLRVVHFITFFLGGLSARGQNVLWATDEDAIAANPLRLRQVDKLLRHVAQAYVPHRLGVLVSGTTAEDGNARRLEDFVAIPDLVAGALSEFVTAQKHEPIRKSGLLLPPPEGLSPKTDTIMGWFPIPNEPLKRLAIVVEPAEKPAQFYIRPLSFHRNPAYTREEQKRED